VSEGQVDLTYHRSSGWLVRLLGTVLLTLWIVGAAGCGGDNEADRVANITARRAGVELTKHSPPIDARSAADLVQRLSHFGGDMWITALAAEGTTVDGTVTLKISVSIGGSALWVSPDQATRCYRYEFSNSTGDAEPRHIDCPEEPERTAGGRVHERPSVMLARILSAIPAADRGCTAARAQIATAFGRSASVSRCDRTSSDATFIAVTVEQRRPTEHCVSVTLPATLDARVENEERGTCETNGS
jgi:hypothetical protein